MKKSNQIEQLLSQARVLNSSIFWWEEKMRKLIKKMDKAKPNQIDGLKKELKVFLNRGDQEIKNIDKWLEQKNFLYAKTKK